MPAVLAASPTAFRTGGGGLVETCARSSPLNGELSFKAFVVGCHFTNAGFQARHSEVQIPQMSSQANLAGSRVVVADLVGWI